MHVHMLITEGGLTKKGEWVEMPYIDYRIIRKKWQYEILKALKKAMPKDIEVAKIVNWCFKERKNGFNIQAKRKINGKTKKAARYMARYVRHPAIADSRIINYDTKNVTFIYKRDEKEHTVVMDKYEFIHNVVKHIPDKNFKMVRYFGIHARRAKKRVKEVMNKLELLVKYVIKPFSWRKNIKKYKGKDPLKCEKCGGEMRFYEVVYQDKQGRLKRYGGLSSFVKRITKGVSRIEEEKKEEKTKSEFNEMQYSQICMF